MATRLPNGKYRAQVFLGTDDAGKRVYKSFIADTADEAEYEALTFKLSRGKRVEKKSVTLRAAIEAYIQSKEDILSPTTAEGYRVILRNFGDYLDTPLSKVTNLSLQKAFNSLATRQKNKAHNGTSGLSPKTLKNYRGLIKKVLKQNGIDVGEIDVPAGAPVEYATPFDNELTAIFTATKDTKIEIPVLLAAWCSLRESEILGLQYRDFDFEGKRFQIRRARVYVKGKPHLKIPKTKTSTRTVYLPDYIAAKILAQMEEQNLTPKSDAFLFEFSGGYITKAFPTLLAKNGLPHCRFHDLRHAFVSILTAQGVDKKYIQEMGGWATDNVMNQIYKQTSPSLKQEINRQLDQVFTGILPENTEKK